MKATLRLAILVLSVCGVGSDLIAKPASRKSRPLRIVIDASHDGGALVVSARAAPPRSQKPHQGVALADYLKKRGCSATIYWAAL